MLEKMLLNKMGRRVSSHDSRMSCEGFSSFFNYCVNWILVLVVLVMEIFSCLLDIRWHNS